MKTIILSRQSEYGGRPQKLGELIFGEDGRRGITIGYHDGVKYGITDQHLNELLENGGHCCKVEIRFKTTENDRNFNVSRFIAKKLIPKSIKKQIYAQNI